MPSIQSDYLPRGLNLNVYANRVETVFGPIPFYSCVSQGLSTYGQKEMVLTVSSDPDEAVVSPQVLVFFRKVNELARQGLLADVGGYTAISPPGILGFTGALYDQWQVLPCLPGVTAPEDALAVTLVTQDELEVAKRCGNSRILVRLGDRYRYFPFPPWTDTARSGVVTEDFWRKSFLSSANLPLVNGPRITVRREGTELIVRLPGWAAQTIDELFSKVPVGTPFVLLANLDPEADGLLVWQPGQQQPAAIVAPGALGARMGGAFVIMIQYPTSEGDRPNESELFEDGFVMKLRHGPGQNWRLCVRAGHSFFRAPRDRLL